MNTNEISAKQLNADAQSWIEKLHQVMLIQDKGKGTVKSYTAEMILLFKYYNGKTVETITGLEIEQYIVYVKLCTRQAAPNVVVWPVPAPIFISR